MASSTHSAQPLFVLNGSNLNMLGQREPGLYGTTTLAQIRKRTEDLATELGLACDFRQTNHEGVMVDWIQEARTEAAGIILNAGAYTHTSIAILDAMKAFEGPIIEVHISNIHARDEHHRHSKLSTAARGVICGLGTYGYMVAMQAAVQMLGQLPQSLPTPLRIGPK